MRAPIGQKMINMVAAYLTYSDARSRPFKRLCSVAPSFLSNLGGCGGSAEQVAVDGLGRKAAPFSPATPYVSAISESRRAWRLRWSVIQR